MGKKKEPGIQLDVLLIEDDGDNRQMLHEMLAHVGMTVRSFGNAVEALQAIRERQPDVIVTDLALPGVHGRDLAASLRADPKTSKVPLVAVTGRVAPSLEVVRYFDAFLFKPIDLEVLPDLVRSLYDTVLSRESPNHRLATTEREP